MHEKLKNHIESTFMKDARQMARVWNLRNPTTNMPPVTFKDFVIALAEQYEADAAFCAEDNENTILLEFLLEQWYICLEFEYGIAGI